MYSRVEGAESRDARSAAAGWRKRLARAGLLAAMTMLTLNLFIGSPLLSLWIGSRVQGPGPPSMAAFLAAAAGLGAFSFVLVKMVAAVGRAHDSLIGRRPTVRAHLPWLRSMRGERPHEAGGAGRPVGARRDPGERGCARRPGLRAVVLLQVRLSDRRALRARTLTSDGRP